MADVRDIIEFFVGVMLCALYVYKTQIAIAIGALAVIAVCLLC